MGPPSRPLFRPPPPGFEHDPRWMRWELDHVKDEVQNLRADVDSRHRIPSEIIDRIPWGRLISVIAAWLLFTTGVIAKADLVKVWFGF